MLNKNNTHKAGIYGILAAIIGSIVTFGLPKIMDFGNDKKLIIQDLKEANALFDEYKFK